MKHRGEGLDTRCSQWLPVLDVDAGQAATITVTLATYVAIVGVRAGAAVEQLELQVRLFVGGRLGAVYEQPTSLAVVASHVLANDAPRSHGSAGQAVHIELRNRTDKPQRVQLYLLYDAREQCEAFAPFDAVVLPGGVSL